MRNHFKNEFFELYAEGFILVSSASDPEIEETFQYIFFVDLVNSFFVPIVGDANLVCGSLLD